MEYSEYYKQILPLTLLAIVSAIGVISILLNKKSSFVRSIPTVVIALSLVFLEFIKQRWNYLGDRNLYLLPLHYCSLFVIIIPLAELFGPRMTKVFRPIATCMSFIVTVALYVGPDGILGSADSLLEGSFRAVHSFIFHHFVVMYFVCVVFLRLCDMKMRDGLMVGLVGVIYMAIAIPLSYILNENYCNLLYSVIDPIEELRLQLGQPIYLVSMTMVMTLGTAIASYLYIILYKIGRMMAKIAV